MASATGESLSKLAQQAQGFFSQGGILEASLQGFFPRESQVALAVAVAEAIEQERNLLAEAGTGTGKTFAYLIPALLAKQQTLISTGTKNLQEQLFRKDLPRVVELVDKTRKVALLKGRSNYLCLHRFHQHQSNNVIRSKELLQQLRVIEHWLPSTKSGDLASAEGLPEHTALLPMVTSTAENCTGRKCEYYDQCYLVEARKQALEADVVVINHHLYFADQGVKDTGFGELLPAAELVIFDEAHQLPDIAATHYSQSLSSQQWGRWKDDFIVVQKELANDLSQIALLADKFSHSMNDFGQALPSSDERADFMPHRQTEVVQSGLNKLNDHITTLLRVLAPNLGRHRELDLLIERAQKLQKFIQFIDESSIHDHALWYQKDDRGWRITVTPLDVAKQFTRAIEQTHKSSIFASATLSSAGSFDLFVDLLGLHDAGAISLSSPFDYQQNARFLVPRDFPQPNARAAFTEAIIDLAVQVIAASGGQVFLLFTSHYMVRAVAKALQQRISNRIFVQNDMPKSELLKAYLETQGAILIATSAFWEGIDVQGDKLRAVIIDRLPFTPINDPILKARTDKLRQQGLDSFQRLQVPQACISLKQGAGRLIRHEQDKGLLVLCDNRIVSQAYGRYFLESLPAMQRTRSLDQALEQQRSWFLSLATHNSV